MSYLSKPNLIILEGPDLAGKSTFMQLFSDNGYVKHHFGAGKQIHTAEEYYDDMRNNMIKLASKAMMLKKNVVIDRSWISDAAYEHVRKDGGRTNALYNHAYNSLCVSLFYNIVTVIFLPTWEIIEKRYNKRGDDYLSLKQLHKAYEYYAKICSSACIIDDIQFLEHTGIPTSQHTKFLTVIIDDDSIEGMRDITDELFNTILYYIHNE